MGARARVGGVIALTAVAVFAGCSRTGLPWDEPREATPEPYFAEFIEQSTVDKVDVLFMIDNSVSMADKQAVLRDAIPDLVKRLLVPNCVDETGSNGITPEVPDAPCPGGFEREFFPVRDMHVGVITSSLGGHGADTCDSGGSDVLAEQTNDHAHLMGTRPRFRVAFAGTGQEPEREGFLDWNPEARGGAQSAVAYTTTFQSMVTAAGEFGCGYESQLESIHRFLSDPAPAQRIEARPCSPQNANLCAFPVGVDDELLRQRRAFLRTDSLLAVLLISDENDCSIRHENQGFYAARSDGLDLPRATAACASNPNDVCCVSCISPTPAGCQPDPTCRTNPTLTEEEDTPNLRCFKQKERFGIDFLYPTSRYVNALRSPRLCLSRADLSVAGECPDANGDGAPDIARNPIYADLAGSGAVPRDPSLVYLAGIVGVPWQDLAATEDIEGTPIRSQELRFRSAAQLAADDVWSVILGNPSPAGGAAPILPTNALMIESPEPRSGLDGQGVPLAPPASPPLANPINGHEWLNLQKDDLQYACIFRLREPRDCSFLESLPEPQPGCDCSSKAQAALDPLCQNDAGGFGSIQRFAKAYPGLRELEVLRDFGDNAIVGSICARNLEDRSRQDFGYRPAIDAIVDRLREGLADRCFHRRLSPDPETGRLPCTVMEIGPPGMTCDGSRNRVAASGEELPFARKRLAERGLCDAPGRSSCAALSLCEVRESGPECHSAEGQAEVGWCYVDPEQDPADDPSIVASCVPGQKRLIRFIEPEGFAPDAELRRLIVCRHQ